MATEALAGYLVRGEDPTLVSQALSRLLAELSDGDELSVEHASDDASAAALVEALRTPSLFGGRKIVVARDAGRFPAAEAEELAAYLAGPEPSSVLVLVAGGGTLSRKLSDATRKHGHIVEAGVSSRAGAKERSQWFSERLGAAEVKLAPTAAKRLIAHLGEEVGRLDTLLAGLAAAYGEGATVTEDELEPFLGQAGGVAPWDLTDAIDRGDTAGAITALHRMMAGGQRPPIVVLASLSRHVLGLLRIDGSGARNDAEAADVLGLKPFPARKVLSQARKLGSDKIRRAVKLTAEADLGLRGASEWPAELVLEVLVARLSRLA
jgi:DNA polymerase III subunit delta